MAPVSITDDFYMILELEQSATLEEIVRSYRRLALKLHPDRNKRANATQAFQLLGEAHETLKDETQRRMYDRLYPSIKQKHTTPQTDKSNPPPRTSKPRPTVPPSETDQIAALQKSKEERGARWRGHQNVLDSAIFELQRDIRNLEQEIKNIDSIIAATAAEDAKKNSWETYFWSGKVKESDDEKEKKDREKQERKIQKDMKERRLEAKNTDLKSKERLLNQGKEGLAAADLIDNKNIKSIRDRIRAREDAERQARERAQRQREWEQFEAEQQKMASEQAEKRRKREEEVRKAASEQAEERRKRDEEVRKAAEILQRRQEDIMKAAAELRKRRTKEYEEQSRRQQSGRTQHKSELPCAHLGWWPKVQGRAACPSCHDVWTYLLECPSCSMHACPKCQSGLRQSRQRKERFGGSAHRRHVFEDHYD